MMREEGMGKQIERRGGGEKWGWGGRVGVKRKGEME